MSTVERWEEQAVYDLETARAMLTSGRYLYVLFCCQQAVEKALKAVIIQKTGKYPPRLNNLLRLARAASIKLDPAQEELLGDLSGYYVQTIYPEEAESIAASVTREIAADALRKTEDYFEKRGV